jgi:hypothetical protein
MISLGAHLERIAKSTGPLALSILSITVAFILMLLSQVLGFGTVLYHDSITNIDKEVGFLSAPNWTIVYAVLFPPYLCLFSVLVCSCEFTLKSLLETRVITGPGGAEASEESLFAAWKAGLQKLSIPLWALLFGVIVQTSSEWLTTCAKPIFTHKLDSVVDWSTIAAIEPQRGIVIPIAFTLLAYLYMGFALFIYLAILVYAAGFALFLNRIADPSGQFRLVLRDVTLGKRLSDIGVSVYFCTILGLCAGLMMRIRSVYLETAYSNVSELVFSDLISSLHMAPDSTAERATAPLRVPSAWTGLLEIAFTLLMLFAVIYLLYDTFEKARQYYIDHITQDGWRKAMQITYRKTDLEAIRHQPFLATVFPHYIHMTVIVVGIVASSIFVGYGSIPIATVLYATLQFGLVPIIRRDRHSTPGPKPADRQMGDEDRERLVELLAHRAESEGSVIEYFQQLVLRANIPDSLRQQVTLSGQAEKDARDLIDWAMEHEVNPEDERFTTLGSILVPELRRLKPNEISTIVALIVRHQLIRNDNLLDRLRQQFLVPERG